MKEETNHCKKCASAYFFTGDDLSFYKKIDVLPPSLCPECRSQERMLYRNFKTLYKRPSSKSGKTLVSMYNEDAKFPVYEISEWWSDDWDPMDYGMDVDLSKDFFDQLKELFDKVPHPNLVNSKSVNCEYSNMTHEAKNCYLVFGCVSDEDCDYGHIVWNSKDSIDNLYIFKSETCYECVDVLGSAKLFYSQECEACVDSIGLFDCRNCINCIGCVGQMNKSYCIFNKQVTKEEYKSFLEEHPLHKRESIEFILNEMEKLRSTLPQRSFFGSHNNNVSGNHIYNSRNVFNSFDIKSGENSKYCFTVRKAIDTYDASFSPDVSECYQVLNCVGNKIMGSHLCVDSNDISYSDHCYNCNEVFGCFGLKKKSYCIFNKQYSKEEYFILKEKIIEKLKNEGVWGNFFPPRISPFSYNESIVNEYMPLSKDEAISLGFTWRDNIPFTSGQGTKDFSSLPENPEDYDDSLLKEVFTCVDCDKNFRLINRELNFYRRNKLSVPNSCFSCRHQNRMDKRNPRILTEGNCAKCGESILTSYDKNQQNKYKIYCEKCYQQEVY